MATPTFIPKRPQQTAQTTPRKGRAVGLVMIGALVIFFGSLAGAAGLYLYKALLERQVKSMSTSVERAKEAIDPALIERIKRLDARIEAGDSLLGKHVILTPLFALLSERTLPSVRFGELQFRVNEKEELELKLNGEAKSYTALALQSDLFGEDPDITEPIFSNLRLNANGNVAFDLTAKVKKAALLYDNNLAVGAVPSPEPTAPAPSGENGGAAPAPAE